MRKDSTMRLKTVRLVGMLALVLLMAPLPTPAQQARTVYRIGYMSIPSREAASVIPVFVQALRARGLVEGENLFIEWRWAEGQLERLPVFAQDLVQRRWPSSSRRRRTLPWQPSARPRPSRSSSCS